MHKIVAKQESSAQSSTEKKFVAKSPKCGYAKSPVEITACQNCGDGTGKRSGCKVKGVSKNGVETN